MSDIQYTETWYKYLNDCQKFISKNNKKPTSKSLNEEEMQLGVWLGYQVTQYKLNNLDQRDEFSAFLKKYSHLFKVYKLKIKKKIIVVESDEESDEDDSFVLKHELKPLKN
jgi:hypothetical protein